MKSMDAHAFKLFKANPNMLIPWYLMASYAYYLENDPILSDAFFDCMSQTLLKLYDSLNHHHLELITKDDLRAGTYLGAYPTRAKHALANARLNIPLKPGKKLFTIRYFSDNINVSPKLLRSPSKPIRITCAMSKKLLADPAIATLVEKQCAIAVKTERKRILASCKEVKAGYATTEPAVRRVVNEALTSVNKVVKEAA